VLVAQTHKALSAVGAITPVSRAQLIAIAAVVLAPLLTPAGRRLRVWRSYVLTVLAFAVLPTFLASYLAVTSSDGTYYLEKTLTALSVVLLLGIGSVSLLLPSPLARAPRASERGLVGRGLVDRAATPAMASLLALGAASALGLVQTDTPYRPTQTGQYVSVSRYWSREAVREIRPVAAEIIALADQLEPEPDVVTILLSGDRVGSYFETTYLAMYERSMQTVDQPTLAAVLAADPDGIAAAASAAGNRLRLVVRDAGGDRLAAVLESRYPAQVMALLPWPPRPAP
jgi:hypothetical protein